MPPSEAHTQPQGVRTGSLVCTALLLPCAVMPAAPPTTVTARRWSFTGRAWWTGGRLTDIDERVSGVQRTLDGMWAWRELATVLCSCRRRVDEVPDAVSLRGPTILPWTCRGDHRMAQRLWSHAFAGPSRYAHARWSVIARCRSQWFSRESIVIIHHFSCIHIIWLLHSLFACFTPAENLLIIATILLASSYLRIIHRLISRYLPSPANTPPPISVARSARSGAYCNV
jgi:hypothetical protein